MPWLCLTATAVQYPLLLLVQHCLAASRRLNNARASVPDCRVQQLVLIRSLVESRQWLVTFDEDADIQMIEVLSTNT
jgi:hypothetical protein